MSFWRPRGDCEFRLSPKKALDLLRSQLEDTSVEAQLRLGGEPGVCEGVGLSNDYLDRWLNAEKYNVQKAFTRLVEHAEWRAHFVPAGSVHEDEFPDELAQGKTYMCEECDGMGRPVYITISCRHMRAGHNLEQNKRSCVFYMDLALRMAAAHGGDGRVTSVVDSRGVRWENADLVVTRQIHELMTAHYPERLGSVYIFEPPSWFHILWRAMYPLMSEVTRSRIHLVTAAQGWAAHPHLLQVLPEDMGGQGKPLVPVSHIAERYQPCHVPRPLGVNMGMEEKRMESDSEDDEAFVDASGNLDELETKSLDS